MVERREPEASGPGYTGILMSSVVPPPAGLITSSVPPSASMRSLSRSVRTPRRGRLPDPVVTDRQPHDRVRRVEFDVHDGCVSVLGRVGQRL